jgi:hypothetical protein
MIKQAISNLLDAEMERKDFLKMVGLGLVATTGVVQMLNALSQQPKKNTVSLQNQGYGGSTYGGVISKR